jgi:hypothetical protein
MEQLTVIYKEVEPDVWNGIVIQYPNIMGYKMEGKEKAIETMYFLITEELFYRTKNFNSWRVSRELYVYLGSW